MKKSQLTADKIFVIFCMYLLPAIIISSVYISLKYIFVENMPIDLKSHWMMRDFIKICLVVYSIYIGLELRNNIYDFRSIFVFLTVIAVSPFLIEIPFVMLSIKYQTQFNIGLPIRLLPYSLLFSLPWLAYFIKKKKNSV